MDSARSPFRKQKFGNNARQQTKHLSGNINTIPVKIVPKT